MSESKRLLENKLNEFSVIQFGANRIMMQNKKSKRKFIYKEVTLTSQNNILLNQVSSRMQIDHDNLIKIDYYCGSSNQSIPDRIGIFYEYYVSDLQKQLNNRIKMKSSRGSNFQNLLFSEEELINTFTPIIQAIKCLHHNNRNHGFINPKVIIITEDYETKLCDRFLINEDFYQTKIFQSCYYPPEYKYGNIIDKNFDFWSLGIVILECACLANEEDFYNRNQNKIELEKISKKLLELELNYSDEFIVGLKLLLSQNIMVRHYGLDILMTKKIPLISQILHLKPKRISKNLQNKKVLQELKCQSLSPPKRTIELHDSKITSRKDFTINPSMVLQDKTQKKIILRQNQNKYEQKKQKIEQLKQKFKSKLNEEAQLKKKQIQKINKIIERSNAFVNQLMVKKLEKHQDKQRSKMPSLLKTATLFSKTTQNAHNTSISNNQNKIEKVKEDFFTTKKKQSALSKQSPTKQQRDKILLLDKLRSPSKKK